MTRTERAHGLALVAMLIAGCTMYSPMTGMPSAPGAGGQSSRNGTGEATAVVRRPLQNAQPPAAVAAPSGASSNALYVCMTDGAGERKQTAIEFAANVAALCTRHPEMGPCQYERQRCRSAGGRVFAADGQEITRAMEDAYDRKVMRVRFRAN